MKNKIKLSLLALSLITLDLSASWYINGEEVMADFPLPADSRSTDNGGLLSPYEAATDGVGVIIDGNGQHDDSDIQIDNTAYNTLVYKYGEAAEAAGLKVYEQVLIGTNDIPPTYQDRVYALSIKNDYLQNASSGLVLLDGTPCDDNNADTIDDMIVNGVCVGTCYDGDNSTIDTLVDGVCTFTTNPADNTCTGGFAGDITTDINCDAQALTDSDLDNYVGLTSGTNIHLENNNFTTLLGLSGLRDVSVMLYLTGNNLINVDGLENLYRVYGGLYLSNNDIENVNGLKNLISTQGLLLSNNSITSLSGLSSLQNTYYLYLDGNQFTNLNGLESLEIVGQLVLNNNTNLTDLSGLENLSTVQDVLSIEGTGITTLTPLRSLVNLNKVYIRNNKLTDVNGLNQVSTLELIYGDYNYITNLNGLSGLNTVTSYLSFSNNSLTDITGLSNVTTLPNLFLANNNLTNLNGLENISSMSYLQVTGNDITDISALSGMTSIDTLLIYDNPNLEDLTPLTNVQIPNVIKIDNRDYGVKLDASTWICQNAVVNDKDANVLPISLICN